MILYYKKNKILKEFISTVYKYIVILFKIILRDKDNRKLVIMNGIVEKGS